MISNNCNSSTEPSISSDNLSRQLSEELEVLSKLLYRNQNQHGKTRYYRQIKKFYKTVTLLPIADFANFEAAVLHSARAMQGKYDRDESKIAIACCNDLDKLLTQCSEVRDWALKASESILIQLEMQVFVALLTAFLSCIARAFRLLKLVYQKFAPYREAIIVNLRRITLLNPVAATWVVEAINGLTSTTNDSLLNETISSHDVRVAAVGRSTAAASGIKDLPLSDEDIGEGVLVRDLKDHAVNRNPDKFSGSEKRKRI